jgi:hypothetical protein
MDKKRGGFFRGIVDNFRSSVSSGGSTHSLGTAAGKGGELLEFEETLRPEHFDLTEVRTMNRNCTSSVLFTFHYLYSICCSSAVTRLALSAWA